MTRHEISRVVPLLATVAIVACAWVLIIRPATSVASLEAGRVRALRARLAALQAPAAAAGVLEADPAAHRERLPPRVAAAVLIASLRRLAIDAGTTSPIIEHTADSLPVAGGGATGDTASGQAPRGAVVDGELHHLSISFEASGTAMGTFMERLDELPAVVGIQRMTVRPRGSDGEGASTGDARAGGEGRLLVSLELSVYARAAAEAAPAMPNGAER